jgi:predicted kinase
MLIIMAGLPGCGKTTLAIRLAAALNAVVLSKDVLRHTLFPPELVEYSVEQDDFVVDLLLRTAEYLWNKNAEQTVILDGRTFSQQSQRQRVTDFAQRLNQPTRIVECVCAEPVAKQRLADLDSGHPAGNRNPGLYDTVKARWQEIPEPKIVVRTDGEIDVDEVVSRL